MEGELKAAWSVFTRLAAERIHAANKAVNREMRIASLMHEKERLFAALGKEVYSQGKSTTETPYMRRLHQIDKDLSMLQSSAMATA